MSGGVVTGKRWERFVLGLAGKKRRVVRRRRSRSASYPPLPARESPRDKGKDGRSTARSKPKTNGDREFKSLSFGLPVPRLASPGQSTPCVRSHSRIPSSARSGGN